MIQRVNGSLAVSRALGDFEYKNVDGKGPTEQLVSENLCNGNDRVTGSRPTENPANLKSGFLCWWHPLISFIVTFSVS